MPIHFTATLKELLTASQPGLYPGVQGLVDEYFLLRHRGETPWRWGIFSTTRTLQESSTTGSGSPSLRPASSSPALCRRRDRAGKQLFQFGQRLRPRFSCELRADRREDGNPLASAERETPVPRSTRGPLMVEFNLVLRIGARSSVCRPNGGPSSILMSAAAFGALGVRLTRPEPGSRRGLAHRSFTCPQDWYEDGITEGSCQPHQAVAEPVA